MSYSRTQHSDSCESQTNNTLIPSLSLYQLSFHLIWFFMSRSTVFQLCRDGVFLGWTIMCLAQEHNTVRREPMAPRSWVKHSTNWATALHLHLNDNHRSREHKVVNIFLSKDHQFKCMLWVLKGTHWDDSFEYPHHMFCLRNKKINYYALSSGNMNTSISCPMDMISKCSCFQILSISEYKIKWLLEAVQCTGLIPYKICI